MIKTVKYAAIAITAFSLTGCFDEESGQSKTRESRLIAIEQDNCTTAKMDQFIDEYGKEAGQTIANACFLRGSKGSFGHYSSATKKMSVFLVNAQNCSAAELAKYGNTTGIEELRLSCSTRDTRGPVKSKPMSW